jgi:hypothetical protein
MARAFLVVIGFCFLLGSCTQRMICPAFQSAYIHDKDALRKKFSYFLEDSTPKVFTASKNKYLIAEPTAYRKKIRSMQTVEMKPVPVIVPDSLLTADSVDLADLDKAARSVIDSTFIEDVPVGSEPAVAEDSVYVITKDKELRLLKYNGADSLELDSVSGRYITQKNKYYVKDVRLNVEQDNYMWYLRDNLVLPDVRLAKLQQGNAKAEARQIAKKKEKGEKKGLKGFFKNLFKKKQKTTDSTEVKPPVEEFDFIDADTLTQDDPPIEEPETREGFFAPGKNEVKEKEAAVESAVIEPAGKKKKRKKSKTVEPDPKKKTEEDDGF